MGGNQISVSKVRWFEFDRRFCVHFRNSRYVMGRNRMPKSNIMAICICSKLLCSISSVLVYYGPQSHLRVKSYARLNFPVDSRFNFECLDLLWAVVGHLSQKLWHLEFARRFCVQFRESRSVMGHNQPFESNVMAI